MRTEPSADRLHRRLGGEPGDGDTESGPEDRDTSLTRWLPDQATGGASAWLADLRADPGRAGAVGLVIVGVLAVVVTIIVLANDDRPTVVAANLPAVEPVSTSGLAAPIDGAPPVDGAPVVVSVVGLVRAPGLVTLDSGARIADALEAAGGPLQGADLTGLNMARRVADGEQVVVGIAAPPGTAPAMGSSISTGTVAGAPAAPVEAGQRPAGVPVDLNTATVEELDTLPGVGPVTAAAIVAWRSANGSFGSVEQLGEVDGIGPARLEKLRDLVRV